MTELLFELKDIDFKYDSTQPALRDINLCIFPGESVAIVGSNGSGKSTLLKILNGLLLPTKGTIIAFGMDLVNDILKDEAFTLAFRRKVGFVFQDPDVQLFSPTVWDEVAFGPLQLGLSRAEVIERVENTLDLLEIRKLSDRAPYRLSGGEKRKVALASVLTIQPDVLLLDEPTSNLDPRSRLKLTDFLVYLHQSGKTIITATHDLDTLEEIADKVFVMGEDNRLKETTSARDLLNNRDLLLAANLIHEHEHNHYYISHNHTHKHIPDHRHEHK